MFIEGGKVNFLIALFFSVGAYSDSCSIELQKKDPRFASRFEVQGEMLSDGTKKAKLGEAHAEALCGELNRIVWDARRAQTTNGKKSCVVLARVKVESTREDFQLCESSVEQAGLAMEWIRVKVLPVLRQQ